jgi:hypothetical protein
MGSIQLDFLNGAEEDTINYEMEFHTYVHDSNRYNATQIFSQIISQNWNGYSLKTSFTVHIAMFAQSHGLYRLMVGRVAQSATGYGLDGPGIESRWGRDFPNLSRPTLGPTQPPVQWVSGLSRRYKAAGVWRLPLTPF